MVNQINNFETKRIDNTLHLCEGFGSSCFLKGNSNSIPQIITLEEARNILNTSLGNKSFFDYIRQERDER